MPDCQAVLDCLKDAEVFSCLDLKAGFWNLPITTASIPYCGIITQDGVYEACRMQFGFKSAPAHFQRTIVEALLVLPDGRIVIYIDDIALWARLGELDDLWRRTLEVIRVLTDLGFMVNIRKSKLLTTRA